jgi:4-alpha-glucanotransferase
MAAGMVAIAQEFGRNSSPRKFKLNQVTLALLIHSHQPVGNFDHVVEEAYQKSYRPFAETLEAHPKIRMSLHYSGVLLEWLEKHHPEFFSLLKRLVERGQAELVGGGFYEPILPAVPDADKVAQIKMLADYLQHHFGARPRGAWVAERVWEPSLARPLAEAGVDYSVLDDTHFLAAGLEPHQLHGAYITEEVGAPLRLVPSLQILRYTIPFRDVEETMRVLREGVHLPACLFASGDDCEKFGVWPGTYDHCYTNKWLEKFLSAVEEAGEWLETSTLSSHLDAHAPIGRVYLPTASYAEMMEWALPPEASREFKNCVEESNRMPSGERFRRFLRGGLWQNFLSKYPESNQLHKLMLEASRRWHQASTAGQTGKESQRLLAEARTHLLAGQCNDPYWHGIFGGLYAPHLRSAVLRHLIQSEALLDKLQAPPGNPGFTIENRDFDVDGQSEILVSNATFGMVLRPSDGGTVSSLRFKPADVELVNSLMRRPEAYHDMVRQKVSTHDSSGAGPASIHDRVWSKESNLSALLRYDRYGRHAFRTYLFPATMQCDDYNYLRLEENAELAGGAWTHSHETNRHEERFWLTREVHLASNREVRTLGAAKEIRTSAREGVWRLSCRSTLAAEHGAPSPLALGIELVFNLLAPDAPDRYFQANQTRWPLEFLGEMDASQLLLVDEWQGVRISLEAEPRPRWWIVPIETISQSESGFERVYQGSAILAVWKLTPSSWRNVTCSMNVEISHWK